MDKTKSLKPLKYHKEVLRLNNLSNDKKIVEFKKYYAKCQEIENSFKIQIENDIITLNEVREKREKMTKSLEKLVLEIHICIYYASIEALITNNCFRSTYSNNWNILHQFDYVLNFGSPLLKPHYHNLLWFPLVS